MSTKTSEINSVITPFIKQLNGVELILWDYSFREGICTASMYKSFLCMTDDYLEYVAVRFERLWRSEKL